jgi:hypothetical protein
MNSWVDTTTNEILNAKIYTKLSASILRLCLEVGRGWEGGILQMGVLNRRRWGAGDAFVR